MPVNEGVPVPFARVVLGWKELHPDDATTLESVVGLLRDLGLTSIIFLCSASQILLGRIRGGGAEAVRRKQQIDFVREVMPESIAKTVVSRLENHSADVVFHQEQLLLASALALCFVQPNGRKEWDREKGAELFLRVNDLLELSSTGNDQDDALKLVLRRLGALGGERESYLLARYFDLMLKRPREVSGHPSPIDTVFEEATGMAIERFLALGLAYASLFSDIDTAADLQTKG